MYNAIGEYYTFSGTLKEEPYNEHLQPSHANHQTTFHNAKVENPRLRALHRAKISIFPSAEIFLIPVDSGQITRYLQDRLLKSGGLFWRGPLPRG